MKDYRVFLIDLDGTVYRGKETVESGVRFCSSFSSSRERLFVFNQQYDQDTANGS